MSEQQLVQSILAVWGAHPRLRIARINTGFAMIKGYPVTFGVPGTGDIVGLIAPAGKMLMIECKSLTGTQSKAQIRMQFVVTKFGGLYVLAKSLLDVSTALATQGIHL